MEAHQRAWLEEDQAIREMAAGDGRSLLNIGGRFICASDEHDDQMSAALANEGLSLCDSGQCEIVGFRQIQPDETALRLAITDMRQLAVRLGYRLISVEAGDFEGGTATVLASEAGYIPWWREDDRGHPRYLRRPPTGAAVREPVISGSGQCRRGSGTIWSSCPIEPSWSWYRCCSLPEARAEVVDQGRICAAANAVQFVGCEFANFVVQISHGIPLLVWGETIPAAIIKDTRRGPFAL